MDPDPHHWIASLRASHDRLAALAGPLDTKELEGPSYDSEWTIAQVLSHLGSQAEIFSLFGDAALEGRDLPGQEAFSPIWDAWNSRTPDAQAADGLAVDEAFVRRAEGLTDEQLSGIRLPMFGQDLDAAALFRMRLGEHAVHTWDVAVALDPSAEVSSDAVDLLIDGLGDLVGWGGKVDGGPRRVRVRTTGPDRDVLISVSDAVSLGDWDDGEADAVLTMPAPAFLRLIYGRLDGAHTPPVTIDGPSETLDDLRLVFPGF
jgi:uncharacterized protein (TIGR03083 family)